jgi:hypothetical protein
MPYLTSYDRYIPDAVELVFHDDYADTLDDEALSNAVMSMVAFMARQPLFD